MNSSSSFNLFIVCINLVAGPQSSHLIISTKSSSYKNWGILYSWLPLYVYGSHNYSSLFLNKCGIHSRILVGFFVCLFNDCITKCICFIRLGIVVNDTIIFYFLRIVPSKVCQNPLTPWYVVYLIYILSCFCSQFS